jgi:tol-pal system protein YbgF
MTAHPGRLNIFLRTVLLWSVPVALTACIADMETMKTDIESLRQVSYQNQKKAKKLEGTASALQKDLKNLKEQTRDIPREDSMASLRKSQSTLFSQVSDVLRELQVINGRFDEYKYFMDRSMEKTASEIEVIKSKLDSIPTTGNAKELNARLSAIEADIALLKGQLEAIKGLRQRLKEDTALPLPPDQLYKEAYNAFNEKKYKESRKKMQDFLGKYPKHNLAGNAIFWIGETYYMEKSYEDAILAYEDVLQKHKDNPKVPSAMLKQAYAFLKISDKKAAKAILNDLIKKYPKDKMASTARDKLKKIK